MLVSLIQLKAFILIYIYNVYVDFGGEISEFPTEGKSLVSNHKNVHKK